MTDLQVLLVDDHALVGEALARVLRADGIAARWCGDAAMAMDLLRGERWSAVLLDVSMPGADGMDVLKRIRAAHPALPVLMLSMHAERLFAVRALRGGAAGYLTKDSAPEVLLDAVRTVAAGRHYLTAEVAEHLARRLHDAAEGGQPHDALSDRELQVLMHLAQGQGVSEVARVLHLSVKTVSTHKTRLMDKMAMANDADLVRYAVSQGWT